MKMTFICDVIIVLLLVWNPFVLRHLVLLTQLHPLRSGAIHRRSEQRKRQSQHSSCHRYYSARKKKFRNGVTLPSSFAGYFKYFYCVFTFQALIGIAFSLGFLIGPMIGAYFATQARTSGGDVTFFSAPALCAIALAASDLLVCVLFFKETLPPHKRVLTFFWVPPSKLSRI